MDDAKVQPTHPTRLPSLDGLRAISIVLVLVGHLSGTQGFGRLDLGIGNYAHLGVVVFFVISGFLITELLRAEFHRKGKISLKLFYARRALRLFPPAYAYLACLCLFWFAGFLNLSWRDVWYAATYTANHLIGGAWEVGHLWSLSVEEQFYLLWPLAFFFAGPARASWVALAVVVLGPVARLAFWYFLTGSVYKNLEMFPVVADSLAVGCLLASVRGWLEKQPWYLYLFRSWAVVGTLVVVLVLNRFMRYSMVWIFGSSIVNIGLALLIHRAIFYPDDVAGRILNSRPFVFVGTLSYSLYLWQQPFLNRASTAWINSFPQNILAAVAVALASYYLLEKPLFRVRSRLRG